MMKHTTDTFDPFEIARFSATATQPPYPLRPIRGAIGSIGFHLQSIVHPLNKPIKESLSHQHVFQNLLVVKHFRV